MHQTILNKCVLFSAGNSRLHEVSEFLCAEKRAELYSCNSRKLTLLLHTITESGGPANNNTIIIHHYRITMDTFRTMLILMPQLLSVITRKHLRAL